MLLNRIVLEILYLLCAIYIEDAMSNESNKCMEETGHFPLGPPFYHPFYRAIVLPPFDMKRIKLIYWLYTPSNKNKTMLELTEDSLRKSRYDKSLKLAIFIHGFGTNMKGDDAVLYQRFTDSLLQLRTTNVIFVDWTCCNLHPYPQAVSNARLIGKKLYCLIAFLQKYADLAPKNVHMIGHSLGCHLAGWTGEEVRKKGGKCIGRITGCDCAGPLFQHAPNEVRFDHTDACFTDMIGTNAANNPMSGFGTDEPICGLNFWPNGGSKQPGCEKKGVRMDVSTATGKDELGPKGCNHFRCLEYLTDSILKKDSCIGTVCESYRKYKRGGCESYPKITCGYWAEKSDEIASGSNIYFDTSDSPPYFKPS